MGKNPYTNLPKSAFWKTGVAQENPYAIEGIYKKKFDISPDTKVATAGSCFAQHISRHLKRNGYNVLDVEPPPPELPENLHQSFGFSMYSARYGNIYTVRQLLQLAQEVAGEWTPQEYIWEKDGKFYDALRPTIEPEGINSPQEVAELRSFHIARVRELFQSLDLFIFTLGLTEMWVHKESGTVYPTAPGIFAGEFDDNLYEFKNAQYGAIKRDFNQFQKVLKKIRGEQPFKILLTVSPVPLTGTASGKHILVSTIYSKATLRSVAGQLSTTHTHIDYFPSYEIVTNPRLHSSAYADNLRSVRDETVDTVMRHFFSEHPALISTIDSDERSLDLQCEEALIDAFSNGNEGEQLSSSICESVGNSHLGGFKRAMELNSGKSLRSFFFYPNNWMNDPGYIFNEVISSVFTENIFRKDCRDLLRFPAHGSARNKLILVGLGMFGDGIIRTFGEIKNKMSIPHVNNVEEVEQNTIKGFENLISWQYRKIIHFKKSLNCCNFIWISAPMPSETSAIERFGASYVESCSQSIYNKVYLRIAQEKFGDLLSDGTILLQPKNTLSKTGFMKDSYKLEEEALGIHASAEYYLEIIKANSRLLL